MKKFFLKRKQTDLSDIDSEVLTHYMLNIFSAITAEQIK